MTYSPDIQRIRTFLDQIDQQGDIELTFKVDAEAPDETGPPRLDIGPAIDGGKLAGDPVEIRVENEAEGTGWTATAEWTESGELLIRRVRELEAGSRNRNEEGRDHRLSVPTSAFATLRRLDKDQSLEVRAADLSEGGLGVWSDDFVQVQTGERVEVELTIVGVVSEVFPGQVAFVKHHDRGTRIGIMFEDLESAKADTLQSTLDTLLLRSTD